MNRRRFFNSIAKAAAIIALAPQIAFRVPKLDFKAESTIGFWAQTKRFSRCVDEEYMKVYEKLMKKEDMKVYEKLMKNEDMRWEQL